MLKKKADKGVVLDKSQYLRKVEKQLSEENMYKKLKEDPTNKIKAEIDNFLEEAETSNIISTEIKTVLVMEYPRVPVMYLVPKIHKSLKDTNGWAIVSGIDCLSTCGYLRRLSSTKKSTFHSV